MGFPNLNRLLMSKCSQTAIHNIHLNELYEKKIAVDISIYLYRFMDDGNFMENMYTFLSLFKYYCIIPIFVFDGKPPVEKQETIKQRNIEKKKAMQEFKELAETIDTYKNKDEIENRLKVLKKKMVKITRKDIEQSVELIQAFGFAYYFAPQEADQLCVHLVKSTDVYATMSDDMDIIISGCSRVIRNLNIVTHSATIYETDKILIEFGLTINQFREIVVLAGSDYHDKTDEKKLSLQQSFELYKKFIETSSSGSFYEWLNQHHFPTEKILAICNMFDISNYTNELNAFLNSWTSVTPKMNIDLIKSIMRQHKFIFL